MAVWQYGAKKFTFTLPQDVAAQFLLRVPPSRRSQYVAAAIASKLREREQEIAEACEMANNSPDIRDIETSFDSKRDESDRAVEEGVREVLEL